MTDSSATLTPVTVPARPGVRQAPPFDLRATRLVGRMRPLVPRLTAQVADRIQDEISPFAGPPDGRVRRTIDTALETAFEHFVDSLSGVPTSRTRVDQLFRAVGRGEALEGRSLHAMRAAYAIGIRHGWAEVHRFAVAQGLPARALGELGDAVFRYVDHLNEQVTRGYNDAAHEAAVAATRRRERLIDAILAGRHHQVARLATAAGWQVPRLLVPAVARTPDDEAGLIELHPRVLVRVLGDTTMMLCPAAAFSATLPDLRKGVGGALVSVGWPVALDEVAHAVRWARRALELVEMGVIASAPVVHCADHLTRLWLHAEPLLRHRACRTELEPLLEVTPHQRLVLSGTLAAWLEKRESAPVLAQRLDVHPQTVRNRLRRLRAMFGDRLDCPEAAFALTLALRASLPLWRAGHIDADLASEVDA